MSFYAFKSGVPNKIVARLNQNFCSQTILGWPHQRWCETIRTSHFQSKI